MEGIRLGEVREKTGGGGGEEEYRGGVEAGGGGGEEEYRRDGGKVENRWRWHGGRRDGEEVDVRWDTLQLEMGALNCLKYVVKISQHKVLIFCSYNVSNLLDRK
ncbi:hypothetical protein Pcinc_020378 [Petrolisthes cinctipes]|uniref:Uncharacterized protein n=1 Tax=Petrolisthes cinctipes TaxID=88211 RepID=A0AAE1KK29_PETCI|nr:hypothetical protein Pcinc_020378 [Petrolisthes cinctipes]